MNTFIYLWLNNINILILYRIKITFWQFRNWIEDFVLDRCYIVTLQTLLPTQVTRSIYRRDLTPFGRPRTATTRSSMSSANLNNTCMTHIAYIPVRTDEIFIIFTCWLKILVVGKLRYNIINYLQLRYPSVACQLCSKIFNFWSMA